AAAWKAPDEGRTGVRAPRSRRGAGIDQAARRRPGAAGESGIGPPTSRCAMYSGRGRVSPTGATRRLVQALNTTNALLRPNGVMFPFEPCIVLQSNTTTEPARGAGAAMPPSATRLRRLSWSGTPYSCLRSDAL